MIRKLKKLWHQLMHALGMDDILCDTCRYDHPHACRNPDRPNATDCDEYAR